MAKQRATKKGKTPPKGQKAILAGAITAAVAADKTASKAEKTLQRMKESSQGDWEIGDLLTVAKAIGVRMTPPTRGSHYKVTSPHLHGILTIPAAKPIKPPYIRKFVTLCRTHIQTATKEDDNG